MPSHLHIVDDSFRLLQWQGDRDQMAHKAYNIYD